MTRAVEWPSQDADSFDTQKLRYSRNNSHQSGVTGTEHDALVRLDEASGPTGGETGYDISVSEKPAGRMTDAQVLFADHESGTAVDAHTDEFAAADLGVGIESDGTLTVELDPATVAAISVQ